MAAPQQPTKPGRPAGPSLFSLLTPYRGWVGAMIVLTMAGNGLNLIVPMVLARAIDHYGRPDFVLTKVIVELLSIAAGIFTFSYSQSIVQTLASERIAKDLRSRLAGKISRQDHAYIQQVTSAKLLTNLTADVDAVKVFVSQAFPSIVSSLFLIVGAGALLLTIKWNLALAVLAVLPVIGGSFRYVMGKVRPLFMKQQGAIDWLNKVINESILGSSLIRLLNSQQFETQKFLAANTTARDIGFSILNLFASLIPVIIFCTNLATLTILVLGGHFVISGRMTLGDFTAFNSYLAILVFPVIVIGFMSNVMAQATASFIRLNVVLAVPDKIDTGTVTTPLRGAIDVSHVTVTYGGKAVLKDVSWHAQPGSRTAIIGPTAAGKTQLLYLLTGLIDPASGTVSYDGVPIGQYQKAALHHQIGLVFQDSILFNLTLRENLAFSAGITEAALAKAIATSELHDFVDALPDQLNTIVSERGTSLSGGQKQRIMLARALALEPRILLL